MHDTREKAMPAVSEKGRYPYDVGIWLRLARVPLEYLLDRLLDCLAEPGDLGAGALAWESGRQSFQPWTTRQPPAESSALELLRQRYARGEIDGATFDQMRERLEASYGPRVQPTAADA